MRSAGVETVFFPAVLQRPHPPTPCSSILVAHSPTHPPTRQPPSLLSPASRPTRLPPPPPPPRLVPVQPLFPFPTCKLCVHTALLYPLPHNTHNAPLADHFTPAPKPTPLTVPPVQLPPYRPVHPRHPPPPATLPQLPPPSPLPCTGPQTLAQARNTPPPPPPPDVWVFEFLNVCAGPHHHPQVPPDL